MSAARRIGLLGGAFDPPHIGHVVMAQEVRFRLELDEVWLVPVGRPPDRDGLMFDAETRVAMVEAALEGHAGLRCSRIEVDRQGPSYTVDTIEQLVEADPGRRVWFILGADRLPGFPGWRHPDRIVAAARLAVVSRFGASDGELEALAARVAPNRCDLVASPTIDVSSTMIRRRLREGAPVRALVPHGVEEILRRS